MGFKDLREFIRRVDEIGELRRVDDADWDVEVGAITEVAARSPHCPMLLFDNIKGHKPGYRLVSNLLHSEKRLCLALGESLDLQGVPLVRAWRDRMAEFLDGPPPVEVDDGPVLQNRRTGDDVDLYEFPSPIWHELDGGRYFAGDVSIVRDPDDGWVNLGIFRLQVHDKSTLGIYIEPRDKSTRTIIRKHWAKGEACPIAISLGHSPGIFLGGTIDAPWGVSEYRIAGYFEEGPVPVLRAPYTGLPVPATSEAVLEGEVVPLEVECHDEGPFGEALGYYASGKTPNEPVVKVKSIIFRDNPIIHGAPPMAPLKGGHHFPFNYKCVKVWNDLEKVGIADIRGVYVHTSGFLVISLKQGYAGHAKQALLVAAGSKGTDVVRFIVTVDEDIDPYNLQEVLWAMAMRCEPQLDTEVIKEIWASGVHPSVTPEQRRRNDMASSKILINACKPIFRRDGFPPEVAASPAARANVMDKWWDKIK